MKMRRYQNIWLRYVYSSWANRKGWRTDIQYDVLHDKSITVALFVLEDGSCVFIEMNEMRRALANAPLRANDKKVGPYYVDWHKQTVFGMPVQMHIERPSEKDDLSMYNNI